MKDKTIALLTILLAMPMAISSVEAANWVEVVRFTGTGSQIYTTDYFTCDHVEWRIRWEYTPNPNFPTLSSFSVYIHEKGILWFIDCIYKVGVNDTEGVSFFHSKNGTFYMKINVSTEGYTIIVEQDVDSIPEFTPIALIFALITVSTLAVALSKKFKAKLPSSN